MGRVETLGDRGREGGLLGLSMDHAVRTDDVRGAPGGNSVCRGRVRRYGDEGGTGIAEVLGGGSGTGWARRWPD